MRLGARSLKVLGAAAVLGGVFAGGVIAGGLTGDSTDADTEQAGAQPTPTADDPPSTTTYPQASVVRSPTATPTSGLRPAATSTPASASTPPSEPTPSPSAATTPTQAPATQAPAPTQAPLPTATNAAGPAPEPGSSGTTGPEGPLNRATFPPVVTSVSPPDGSTGIALFANIAVHFDVPMDQPATEAAFEINPTTAGTFSWQNGGTVLNFDPDSDFAYNTVVTVKVGASARGLDGVELGQDYETEFTVLRLSTVALPSVASLDGSVLGPGFSNVNGPVDASGPQIQVGQASRGYLAFDLSALPQDLDSITSAEVSVFQPSHTGNPFATMGSLMIEAFDYGTLDAGDYDPVIYCVIGNCDPVYWTALTSQVLDGVYHAADVTYFVQRDWEDRATNNGQSQYRLRFERDKDAAASGSVALSSGDSGSVPELYVTYVHP